MNWPKLWRRQDAPAAPAKRRTNGLSLALAKFEGATLPERYQYPVDVPKLMAGVLPAGMEKALVAMDSAPYEFARSAYCYGAPGGYSPGFPGYPYLATLTTRAEYRAMASALASQLTREGITINSSETAGESTKDKVTQLTQAVKDMRLLGIVAESATHDCYYGRGQIAIDIAGQDIATPLVISNKTVKKGAAVEFKTVEAMWTTPAMYNAQNPLAKDFYEPREWFMLGKKIHASRLLTTITREVPDMLKPAFNFGGISLSQLAEPYVDNWLRTRQSVADLINNFSITALATSMDQVLQGTDDGENLFRRAKLFTAARSNQGLMLLDKDREDLKQINTPLSGLHELQSQALEQMCFVSHLPAIILTGLSPQGLNASSEGEIRTFYDWIAGEQESYWRTPIDTMLKILQLSMFGEIDPDISFTFNPLYQMTPKELAEIRLNNANAAATYIDRGVIDPSEERERLARDTESGYQGLDLDLTPTPPEDGEDDDEDEE